MNHNEMSSLQKENAKRQLLGTGSIANKMLAYDNKNGCAIAFDTGNWIERDGSKYVYYDKSLEFELEAEQTSTIQSNKTDEAINIYCSPIVERKILPNNFEPTHKVEDMQHFSECILRLPIIYKRKLEDNTFTFTELCKVEEPKQTELIEGLSKYKEFTDFIGYTLSRFGIPYLKIVSQVTFIENKENGLLSDVLYTKFLENGFQNEEKALSPMGSILKLNVGGYVIIVSDNNEDMQRHLENIKGTFREKPNTENNIISQVYYISDNVYIYPKKIEDNTAFGLQYTRIGSYL